MSIVRPDPIARPGTRIGPHTHHTTCRFCHSSDLHTCLDLGPVPLAGGFFEKDSTPEARAAENLYPLDLVVCGNCMLMQCAQTVEGDRMFQDYFYFSSTIKTLVNHFSDYAVHLAEKFKPKETPRVSVELGCNDGVFVKPMKREGFTAIGVDPATNVVTPLIEEGYNIINDYFTEKVALDIVDKWGKADVVLSSNSFAHIDNMHEVMRGVQSVLKPDGCLIFEVHYGGVLLREMQYDMVYHEHMSYYTLITIEKFAAQYGMQVFDVLQIPIHAGSIRFYIQSAATGAFPVADTVAALRAEELAAGLDKVSSYLAYGERVANTRRELLALLDKLLAEGKRIGGYAASGRATIVTSYCKLTQAYLNAGVFDDSPRKHGAWTPFNHIQIRPSTDIYTMDNPPDYLLLFAWSFKKEIVAKHSEFVKRGGKFIVPLPEVQVVTE